MAFSTRGKERERKRKKTEKTVKEKTDGIFGYVAISILKTKQRYQQRKEERREKRREEKREREEEARPLGLATREAETKTTPNVQTKESIPLSRFSLSASADDAAEQAAGVKKTVSLAPSLSLTLTL